MPQNRKDPTQDMFVRDMLSPCLACGKLLLLLPPLCCYFVAFSVSVSNAVSVSVVNASQM